MKLQITVKPNARHTKVKQLPDGSLKVSVNAPNRGFTLVGNYIIGAELMYDAQKIQALIAEALPGARVKVGGMNDHFEALVVWEGFQNKSLVEQHQMVMAPLQEGLKEAIHALSIKTKIKEI